MWQYNKNSFYQQKIEGWGNNFSVVIPLQEPSSIQKKTWLRKIKVEMQTFHISVKTLFTFTFRRLDVQF